MQIVLYDINKAIFLVFLAIGANFIAQTFSCKTQKFLTEICMLNKL